MERAIRENKNFTGKKNEWEIRHMKILGLGHCLLEGLGILRENPFILVRDLNTFIGQEEESVQKRKLKIKEMEIIEAKSEMREKLVCEGFKYFFHRHRRKGLE